MDITMKTITIENLTENEYTSLLSWFSGEARKRNAGIERADVQDPCETWRFMDRLVPKEKNRETLD